MDIFSQNKLLIRTILFLVILNLGSITFFTIRGLRPMEVKDFRPNDDRKKDLTTILKKELNLTNQQVFQFNEIREQNATKKSALKEIINQDKDLLNIEMFNKNCDDQKLLALARKIGDNEYRIELSKINQSKQLKAICNPQQLEKFEELVKEIRDYFRPDNPPNRK
jgi:Spy/CpxP family protein refolding chaperone